MTAAGFPAAAVIDRRGMAVVSYVARRRLKISPGHWREPGEPLPEAHTYFRLDSYLHTGYVRRVEVSEGELLRSIDAFCPDLRADILHRLGIAAPVTGPTGDARTPAQRWAAELPVRVVGPAPRPVTERPARRRR